MEIELVSMRKTLKTHRGVLYLLRISCWCFHLGGTGILNSQIVKIKELNNRAERWYIIEMIVSEGKEGPGARVLVPL